MAYFLLSLSVVLSTGRNLLSKNLSFVRFKTKQFFLCQSILFFFGAFAILLFGKVSFVSIAQETLLYSMIYGALLILAQWFYTAALSNGNTAACSTVYSLGFIFPTLSGAILFGEAFSSVDLLGVLAAVAAVVLSGLKVNKKDNASKAYYFIPLVIAMLASGGLGIVQKVQQKSDYADQRPIFLLIAFLLASVISLLFASFTKTDNEEHFLFRPRILTVAACVGLFFGCCNLLNTLLAGLLESAIFFPTLNIVVILLSTLSASMLFREKLSKKEVCVLILGGISILLLNFG